MWEMILVFICRGHCMLHAQSHMKISCASLHIQKCAKKCTRITQNINTFEDMQGRTQEKRNLWSSSWGSVQLILLTCKIQFSRSESMWCLFYWNEGFSVCAYLHPVHFTLEVIIIFWVFIFWLKSIFFYVFRQMHLVSILDRHMHYTPWHQGW